jgi:predicted TIM-barrel fold metal-dependent hydrolase
VDDLVSTAPPAQDRARFDEVADLLEGIEVLDAHHHLWSSIAPRQPSDFDLLGDVSAMPSRYLAGDLRADAAGVKLIGSVELGGYEINHAELAGLEEGIPSVLVPAARLETAEGREAVRALAAQPAVRGIRQILNWHPDPRVSFVDNPDLMDDPAWREGLSSLAEIDLSFDLQVYPGQMQQAARLAGDFEHLSFVLNHVGMPLGRDDATLDEWRAGMRQLAARPNVSVKLSGFGMTDHRWTSASTLPLLTGAIDEFGPDRSMFASNFPVDRLYASYSQVLAVVAQSTAALSVTERQQVFAGTARGVYRIGAVRLTRRPPDSPAA